MLKELQKLKVFDRITFYDSDHSYKIDGESSAKVSVTGLVSSVKEKFDEEKWAQIKADEFGCTPAEVKLAWKKNNQMATLQGSTLHNYIDNFYQNKIKPYDRKFAKELLGDTLQEMMHRNLKKLVKQFMNFYSDTNEYILPVKNEFVVGDIGDTRVCGMLDMLAYNTQKNTFEIYDFKTNKEFTETSKFEKKLLFPVEHLDECEFSTYSLQLSLYKIFIQKYTNIEIGDIKVVWFSVNNEDYKIINLKYMPEECQEILRKFSAEQTVVQEVNS